MVMQPIHRTCNANKGSMISPAVDVSVYVSMVLELSCVTMRALVLDSAFVSEHVRESVRVSLTAIDEGFLQL